MTPLGALIFVVVLAALLVAWGFDEPRRLRCFPRPAHPPPAGQSARTGDPGPAPSPRVNGSPAAAHGRRGR